MTPAQPYPLTLRGLHPAENTQFDGQEQMTYIYSALRDQDGGKVLFFLGDERATTIVCNI